MPGAHGLAESTTRVTRGLQGVLLQVAGHGTTATHTRHAYPGCYLHVPAYNNLTNQTHQLPNICAPVTWMQTCKLFTHKAFVRPPFTWEYENIGQTVLTRTIRQNLPAAAQSVL